MKKILLGLLLIPNLAFAKYQCVYTGTGYVYINGRRVTNIYFNGATVQVGCTVRRPGWIYWNVRGRVCLGNAIYGHNADGTGFSCRVLNIR